MHGFRTDIPATVKYRVFTYSHYKKNCTATVLIGITPEGIISLRSDVDARRKSDSQLTMESELLDLLKDSNTVLANKGFPEIKTVIDASGKRVQMVMPPFVQKNNEFSSEKTHQTYSVARVRIHVERIMQRLRTYRLLHKNLQPPIISDEKDRSNYISCYKQLTSYKLIYNLHLSNKKIKLF